ncbi:hypothetical protein GCM10010124_27530 [Pilimelia terevasa]|uniref:N-acetyltransferase domain-containing protein n=1 Tax=Pilimelia terevasa TaxID=53372 RepID=A0A8J3BRD3_9ACTN|nr:GNAT family N-acetyltransferase [Pilimelia terevasa]GGK33289.1 hypothetical protein GCM10010124_27530 [Pilimelia terevasa]
MTVRLEPMTPAAFDAYAARASLAYGDELAAAGVLPPAEAREKAGTDFSSLLPQGLDTPGHDLWTAYADDEVVGLLWIWQTPESTGPYLHVCDIEVVPGRRGQGYGRALMEAAERVARERGAASIGLQVFGNNAVARALYDSLGYAVVRAQMKKQL